MSDFNINEIMYINLHYSRKPLSGVGFILFWILFYFITTGAGCIYLWVNK